MSNLNKTVPCRIAELTAPACLFLHVTVVAQFRNDDAFDTGSGFSVRQEFLAPFKWVTLERVVLQDDGKVLVVGGFEQYDGNPVRSFIRLNADGTLDASFNPATGTYAYGELKLQPDGKILFLDSGTRLNPDGSKDQSFVPASILSRVSIFASAFLKGRGLVVGGNFFQNNNFTSTGFTNIIFLSWTGANEFVDVGTGFDRPVYALATDDQDNILVGGVFTRYDNQRTRPLVRIGRDGFPDSSFAPAIKKSTGASDAVNAVVVQADQKILVGGYFDSVGSVSTTSLTRLLPDGTIDPDFATHVAGSVTRILAAPDGKIWVIGDFTSVNGLACAGTARLNGDGSSDIILEQQVFVETVQPDGKVFVIERPLDERSRPLDERLRRVIPELSKVRFVLRDCFLGPPMNSCFVRERTLGRSMSCKRVKIYKRGKMCGNSLREGLGSILGFSQKPRKADGFTGCAWRNNKEGPFDQCSRS